MADHPDRCVVVSEHIVRALEAELVSARELCDRVRDGVPDGGRQIRRFCAGLVETAVELARAFETIPIAPTAD